MRRVVELMGFGVLALGFHLAALGTVQPQDAGAASGAGGAVALEAVDGTVADLVAGWERPPEVADLSPAIAPPVQAAEEVAARPAPAVMPPEATPLRNVPDLTAPGIDSPALPQVIPDTPPPAAAVAEVAPRLAPQVSARPVPRPARPAPKRRTQPPPQRIASPQTSAAPRAVGQGGNPGAGVSEAPLAGKANAATRQSLMMDWGGQIRARIERRKAYPSAAGGASGTVQVAIRIGSDGRLLGLGIAGTSGNAALDAAAVSAVQAAGRFPAAPAALGSGPHSFTLPMAYTR